MVGVDDVIGDDGGDVVEPGLSGVRVVTEGRPVRGRVPGRAGGAVVAEPSVAVAGSGVPVVSWPSSRCTSDWVRVRALESNESCPNRETATHAKPLAIAVATTQQQATSRRRESAGRRAGMT